MGDTGNFFSYTKVLIWNLQYIWLKPSSNQVMVYNLGQYKFLFLFPGRSILSLTLLELPEEGDDKKQSEF